MLLRRFGFTILGIVVLLGVTGCQSGRVRERPLPTYTVEVTGSADASYTGTFEVDGRIQPVSGLGRNTWSFQCEELVANFQQGPEGGLLEFEIRDATGEQRAVATPGPGGECRLSASDGRVEGRTFLRPIEPAPSR